MSPEIYEIMAQTEGEHWWFVGRRRILAGVIKDMGLAPSARILEIGAGTGGNLDMLRRFGQVEAVEMDDYARTMARQKSGIPVRKGQLPDGLPGDLGRFELVCLFDVLEHIEDDVAALERLRGLLQPRGRILLTVPAHNWLWSSHDVRLHHFRRYSGALLRRRCEAAGLGIVRLSYFNLWLSPLAVLARLAGRLAQQEGSLGEETPSAPINWAFRVLFSSEAALLRRFDLPFGISLLTILEAA
ncbi:class I SAM-dependent methyltransferase [Candidatus Methylocalor cossyra]|uniref:Class I SAM-dependent methyltransferase n=1 Tax=Candidatus Methylocalor cossyra TaxID=3108543 RepID=A0ABM9NMG5_9GAMM